jgi:hypothetical protein
VNKDKLKEFVGALDALSDNVKDMGVNIKSSKDTNCEAPWGHAGLISIVAQDLPKLQEIHGHIYFLEYGFKEEMDFEYEIHIWEDALAVFLGFKDDIQLLLWTFDNPKIWGNSHGIYMFNYGKSFGNDEDKGLTHRDIIKHWKQVLKKIENEGVEI